MDFIKKQLDTIQKNLNALNATQKMLTVSLVAIMAITMVWWARYAGTADMMPLLNQTLADDELARMSASLDAQGISNRAEGGKLLVASDHKMQALAELGYQQLLPRNTTTGFDQMFAKSSPWDPPAQRDAMMNHGKELTLGEIISGFPNVSSAVVMIDPTRERRIGESLSPTATVNIQMRGGAPADNKLVDAAATLICGSVSGIEPGKVKVVVDGRARAVKSGASGYDGSGDQLEAIQQWESMYAGQVSHQLQYIDGVVASVTGQLNTQAERTHSVTNDKTNTLSLPKTTEEHSMTSSTSSPGTNEPGATPNVGASLTAAPNTPANTVEETTSKTEFTINPSFVDKQTEKPAGDFTPTSASVRVPINYFLSILRGNNGGKEPTKAELKDFVAIKVAEIKTEVRNCTRITNPDDIFVGTYEQAAPMIAAASTTGSIASGGVMGVVTGWGKELAVGALAVISLFMVSTMVKRSAPAPMVVATPEPTGPVSLVAGEDIAGLASEGGATLAGMELDDDAMQTQQMLDQVTSMVGEDPDAAASLVKRWLNRT